MGTNTSRTPTKTTPQPNTNQEGAGEATEEPVRYCIYSHATRATILQETLQHLRSFGITPTVSIQDEPPSPTACSRNALAVLRATVGGGPVVMMEDDIRLHPRWSDALRVMLASNNIVIACNLEPQTFPPAIRERERVESFTLVGIQEPQQWFGAQCVILPTHVTPTVLHALEDGMLLEDAIRSLIMRWGALTIIPNAAQHLSPPSVYQPTSGYRPVRRSIVAEWWAHE